MRALVVDAPGQLLAANVPAPQMGDYDALVEVSVCGICNSTDSKVIAGTMPYHNQYPAVLGHESIGRVVAVGEKCRSISPGMRFTRPCAVYPGEMTGGLASAWGGFAQYALVKDRLALAADNPSSLLEGYARSQCAVPDGISDIEAALAVSLSEVASWLDKLGDIRGLHIVVLGTGIAGLSAAFFAKHAGARSVTVFGRRSERLAKARLCGADHAFLTSEGIGAVREITGSGAHWLLECSGNAEGFAHALPVLGPGGQAAIYGLSENHVYTLPLTCAPAGFKLHFPQPQEQLAYHMVCELILAGQLQAWQFISHEWAWQDALKAFDQVARREVLKGFIRVA